MSATLSTAAVTGGFRDPVFDAQTAFRRIMNAFAEPGIVVSLGGLAAGPGGIDPAAAALLAALADAEAPIFLDGEPDPALAAWIAFQTGAAVTSEAERAAFALLRRGSDPAGWGRFAAGTDAYPDRSATLVLPVEALEGGPALTLRGPGIESARTIAPRGLPDGFLAARRDNAGLFPRGRDLVLVAGEALMALPRTTRIEEA